MQVLYFPSLVLWGSIAISVVPGDKGEEVPRTGLGKLSMSHSSLASIQHPKRNQSQALLRACSHAALALLGAAGRG